MEDDLVGFFLNRKPVRIMVILRRNKSDNYPSAIARKADATYSHTIKVLQKMNDFDLVEFEKKGRKKEVELTQRGEDIAGTLQHLTQKLRD